MSEWYTGLCSAHQEPDPLCRICNPRIAQLEADLETARRERQLWEHKARSVGGHTYCEDCAGDLDGCHCDCSEGEAKRLRAALESIAEYHGAMPVEIKLIAHNALAEENYD